MAPKYYVNGRLSLTQRANISRLFDQRKIERDVGDVELAREANVSSTFFSEMRTGKRKCWTGLMEKALFKLGYTKREIATALFGKPVSARYAARVDLAQLVRGTSKARTVQRSTRRKMRHLTLREKSEAPAAQWVRSASAAKPAAQNPMAAYEIRVPLVIQGTSLKDLRTEAYNRLDALFAGLGWTK